MYIVDKGGRYRRRRRPFMSEACRQAGRQTDRQAKRKKREEKKRRKYQSAPQNTESFLLCFAVPSILSLSLYYLTLMPFSFGVDDTSFAPFFD